ncbi:MAG TPA: AtpZ/AtpI family protein [Anaerolineales bacterium]|nr:AtpZ/AtpI family protein [Anaerolineales bacterium]
MPTLPMAQNEKPKQDKMQYALNMGLAGLAGTVGVFTLGIVVVALVAGIFLDRQLNTKPLFTILILLGSMPISLYVMFRLALGAIAKIQPPAQPEKKKEEKTGE